MMDRMLPETKVNVIM